MIQEQFDVLIVGTGAAGTSTAIRLMQFASKPLSIVAVERFPQRRNGGLAYGAPGTEWHDIFNIQAGRMSIFREDTDDYLLWANSEADRRSWSKYWTETTFTVSGPAPRRTYADYLADRLRRASAEAPLGTVYRESVGEVDDIALSTDGEFQAVSVRAQDGTGETINRTLHARQVIIATGNEFRHLPFTERCYHHLSFIRLQYSSDGDARMRQVGKDDTVVIIGSELTAYDAVMTLDGDLGHEGPIVMISRHGSAPRVYPEGHESRVIKVRRPPLLNKEYAGEDRLIEDIKQEWQYLHEWLKTSHPEILEAVYSERILKAWEPYLVELIRKMPADEVRRLLNQYETLISNLRVAAMPSARRAIDKSDLANVAGQIESIEPNAAGGLTVTYSSDEGQHSIDADVVISNLCRQTNYRQVKNPLWRNLIDRHRAATPDKITWRGIEVGLYGELIAQDGKVSRCLAAVGLPREGDEIARNGRLGPFAFNVAVLKNHSIATAARTIAVLEGVFQPGDTSSSLDRQSLAEKFVPEDKVEAFLSHVENAVYWTVHWMSAREQAKKRTIQPRLDKLVCDASGLMTQGQVSVEEKQRCLRSVLIREAIVRMIDVSMAPRELRHHLGLAGDESPIQ